jgi:catechol 2,3-dioxygenase-like lactoylglutathione lyase family enzyme
VTGVRPKTLDHVALWLADPDVVAAFAIDHLGMHEIDRTARFVLLGSNARRGKLTLFFADPPRERGALEHVALRVSDLERALAALPPELAIERPRPGEAYFDVGEEGVRLGLVESPTDVAYDLDHVRLRAASPAAAAAEYEALGFEPAEPSPEGNPRVEVAGAHVELVAGEVEPTERPLLNHLAVLVDSAQEHIHAANELGVEIDDVVDAPNTYAVFVFGPDRVRIEYVEHKPSFSLT